MAQLITSGIRIALVHLSNYQINYYFCQRNLLEDEKDIHIFSSSPRNNMLHPY